MSFEDVIRVAQAKTSPERLARVRAEVRAKDGEPLEITEHFKPGIEEIAAILPPRWARRLLAWGERTGRLGKTLFGHTEAVGPVAFAPDGKALATGSDDKTVKVWDLPSGDLRATRGVEVPLDAL